MSYIEQDLYLILGNALKEERRRAKLTLDDVAKRMNVTTMTIQRYEKASRKINVETIRKLCNIYGVNADDLMEKCVAIFNLRNNKSVPVIEEREFNRIVSENLTVIMNRAGTSRADLANYLGVSVTSVASWCCGEKTPRMDIIDRICEYFGITRSDLMLEYPGDVVANEHLSQEILTASEELLLDEFRQLNDDGQDKVCEYTSDLVASGRYSLDRGKGSGSEHHEEETA